MKIESFERVCCGSKVHGLAAGPRNGRAVLLLHGASFSSKTWQEIGTLSTLAESGFRVYAVDLPGFGQSESCAAPEGAVWMKALCDELPLENPIIVSPSMSGRYSLPFVIEYADSVDGFVAVAPVGIRHHEKQLGQMTCPVLAVWGENDRTIPVDHADLLTGAVENGRKVIIPSGSHAPYMSDPATFHRELLTFLAELDFRL